MSDDEETSFFDTNEYFNEPAVSCRSTTDADNADKMHDASHPRSSLVVRRNKLPEPVEKEKGVSLWSMIKDNVGKDLSKVCLPVYFNEPISSLQKCCEDLEYSYLLDRAYEYGKAV